MSSYITGLEARMILDSRGNPTVEVDCYVDGALRGRAAVPSGASTGSHEAVELRDGDMRLWMGKGVEGAITNVVEQIQDGLVGLPVDDQRIIDETMIEMDDTGNKANLGANATLGTSLACLHAASNVHQLPLWRYLGGLSGGSLPVPMMNIINGGEHADNPIDIQEFMIMPKGLPTFSEGLRAITEIFHALKAVLKKRGLSTAVGDEGGFAPELKGTEDAIECILAATKAAGYKAGKQIFLALDVASSEFYDSKKKRYIFKKSTGDKLTADDMVAFYDKLTKKYPIISIEDGCDENDWAGWKKLTDKIGDRVQLVGDDLFVTNVKFLQKGISTGTANSILVKVNQIGSLTETLDAVELAHINNYTSVLSHRSGETEDATIADLAVGTRAGQIKTGAPARSDRVAKYNQLLRIAEDVDEYRSPF